MSRNFNILAQIDCASISLQDGFISRALGRRGAVVFVLLARSSVPDSMAFLLWLGAGLSTALHAEELGLSRGAFGLAMGTMLLAGAWGMCMNLRTMAARKALEGNSSAIA